LFDLVSGARNNGKRGGGFRKGTARRRQRLFGCFCLIIYIFLLWNAFFPYQQTNHLYSIHVRRPRELSPRLFGVYMYNIHIIYAANTPRHADIEHYDLHSNWNEISTKVDRRRRIEIYSCRWFLSLFGYALIIWFGHSIPTKKHQANVFKSNWILIEFSCQYWYFIYLNIIYWNQQVWNCDVSVKSETK